MQRLLVFTLLGSAAAFEPTTLSQLKTAVDACSGDMSDCTAADGTHITVWDVSGVADMSYVFEFYAGANPDLSKWDVSQVTNMERMFIGASAFDSDLSAWDVGQVTNMEWMFADASAFDKDLSAWDVGRVTTMWGMFAYASAFNGDLSAWNVGKVTDMQQMFDGAHAFNRDLSAWDVGQVTTMRNMFFDTPTFNQQLCGPAWIDSTDGSVTQTDMFIGSDGSIATEACELCPAGGFNNAGTCAPCQVGTGGTYSARAGQTICLACPALTISDTTGCSSCQAGMFVNGNSCSNCPAGTYRSATDSAQECVKCAVGKYGTEEGQTSEGACTNCPNGWSTFEDVTHQCNPSYQTHLLNCQTECPDSCAGASADVLVNAILNNPTAYQQAGLCT